MDTSAFEFTRMRLLAQWKLRFEIFANGAGLPDVARLPATEWMEPDVDRDVDQFLAEMRPLVKDSDWPTFLALSMEGLFLAVAEPGFAPLYR